MKSLNNNVEYLKSYAWEAAIRGMRNPKNSWNLSDSYYDGEKYILAPNDLKLALSLFLGGPVHRKYLRQIPVTFDLTLTRAVWSEFDTYHFNTKNSCSTMHKLLAVNSPITKELFLYDPEDEDYIQNVVEKLEKIRKQYVKKDCPNKTELLVRAKYLLPEGFLQKRTISTNYEELLGMYAWRHNHRMPEWVQFCKEIEALPYIGMFIYISKVKEIKKILDEVNSNKDFLEKLYSMKSEELELYFDTTNEEQ